MRLSRFQGCAAGLTLALAVSSNPGPLPAAPPTLPDTASVFIKALEERLQLTDGRCPDRLRDSAAIVRCFQAEPADVLNEAHDVAFELARHTRVLERRWTDVDPRHLLVDELRHLRGPVAAPRRFAVTFDSATRKIIALEPTTWTPGAPLPGFRHASYRFEEQRVVVWVGYDPVADDDSLPLPPLSVVFTVEEVDEPFPEVFPAR